MRRIVLLLMVLTLLEGCATMSEVKLPGVDVSKAKSVYVIDWPGLATNTDIVEIENDLYLRTSEAGFTKLITTGLRQLTHSPDVKEVEVRYHARGGYITYFADDGNGGHWYMQPLSRDDSNRKEISPSDLIKAK